jgi:hypothetical protein
MRIILLVLYSILLSSCGNIGQIQYGYGKPLLTGNALNDAGSGAPVDMHYISAKIGKRFCSDKIIGLDLFFGGFVASPQEHQSGIGGGAILSPRLLYNDLKIKPFIIIDLGVGFLDWDVQATDFNFLVGGGPGLLIPINDRLSATVSFSLFHISNAGIERPNPGVNSDIVVFGLEWRF